MSRLPALLAAALLCAAANAQYWKAVGKGTIGPTEIQTLYGDSVSDRLLAGGTFTWIKNATDTVLGMGQAAWNGSRWDSLAYRIAPSVGQTFWFLRFQGKLYSCGGYLFYDQDGNVNSSFARLNENTSRWESLECTNPFPESGLLTLVPKEPNTTLYATGYMGNVCGYPESCVFRYDGSAFHIWEPFEQIPDGNDNYVGTVFDFQGKTYMSCSLPDPTGPGFVSFIRWNGSNWEHVPGWNTLSPIKDISIHNDTLYVAGTFSVADGGPGNLVAAFDGENWSDMGGGFKYTPAPMSGAALDLEWFHGELWACGRFDWASGMQAHSIAHWDGHRWCVPPGDFQWISNSLSRLGDMSVWRDSLYVCGGILTVDGDTIHQVAQWIGGDVVEDCSTVGIDEVDARRSNLAVYPLADPGQWTVHFPKAGSWVLTAYDALGRSVRNWHANGTRLDIDLGSQTQGLYVLRASLPSGEVGSAKIIQP